MFPSNTAISSFVAGCLFIIAKFLSSGPSSRGELLAYAARELSTACSCPSSCGNVAVGDEEQSHWSWNTMISFVLVFSADSTFGPCQTGMQHGWYVFWMVMSGRKMCHALIPIWDLLGPFPRVGLRPRGRRRLYAFRAGLVDEPLRAAILRAREQVIRMGGDGAHRPMRVVLIGWLC